MTVKQLLEELKTFDQNDVVFVKYAQPKQRPKLLEIKKVVAHGKYIAYLVLVNDSQE
jgi:hypothetical protein